MVAAHYRDDKAGLLSGRPLLKRAVERMDSIPGYDAWKTWHPTHDATDPWLCARQVFERPNGKRVEAFAYWTPGGELYRFTATEWDETTEVERDTELTEAEMCLLEAAQVEDEEANERARGDW